MNLIGFLPSLVTIGSICGGEAKGRIERDRKWAGLRAGGGLKDDEYGEWPWEELAKGEEVCGRWSEGLAKDWQLDMLLVQLDQRSDDV